MFRRRSVSKWYILITNFLLTCIIYNINLVFLMITMNKHLSTGKVT